MLLTALFSIVKVNIFNKPTINTIFIFVITKQKRHRINCYKNIFKKNNNKKVYTEYFAILTLCMVHIFDS